MKHEAEGEVIHLVDRMVSNVKAGRFERSLSGLTAAGASSRRRRSTSSMTKPASATNGCGSPSRLARWRSRRHSGHLQPQMAKTALADRKRGDRRQRRAGNLPPRPGHRPEARRVVQLRYNLEMGPPLLAPLLVTLVGGMGAARRRC